MFLLVSLPLLYVLCALFPFASFSSKISLKRSFTSSKVNNLPFARRRRNISAQMEPSRRSRPADDLRHFQEWEAQNDNSLAKANMQRRDTEVGMVWRKWGKLDYCGLINLFVYVRFMLSFFKHYRITEGLRYHRISNSQAI